MCCKDCDFCASKYHKLLLYGFFIVIDVSRYVYILLVDSGTFNLHEIVYVILIRLHYEYMSALCWAALTGNVKRLQLYRPDDWSASWRASL